MLLETVAVFLGVGAVAGLLSGFLGIGGGVLVVPGLLFAFSHFGFPKQNLMHMAAGTSLAVMVLTTSSSLYGHLKRRIPFWPVYRQMYLGVIFGVMAGGLASDLLSSQMLELIFAIVVLLMALKMFWQQSTVGKRSLPHPAIMALVGIIIGGKSGLLGLGGGIVSIPFLTYFGRPMRQAVVVSVATGLTIAITGALMYMLTGYNASGLPAWSIGFVYVPAWLCVAAASMTFARLGAMLSHKISIKLLKKIFAIVMLAIGIHMLIG